MRTWGIVGAVTLGAAGPAAAFYFPGWPADGLVRPISLYAPTVRLPDVVPLTDVDISRPPGASSRTPAVPEPATLVLAGCGIALLASGRCQPADSLRVQR